MVEEPMTGGDIGRMIVTVLGMVAEMERVLRNPDHEVGLRHSLRDFLGIFDDAKTFAQGAGIGRV